MQYDKKQAAYGPDSDAWPMKDGKQARNLVKTIARLFYTNEGLIDGRGPIRVEITSRQVFKGRADWGWSAKYVGKPITWIDFVARRVNGTGASAPSRAWQAWAQEGGRWVLSDTGWDWEDN